jgi:hypothetical protein
MSDNADTSEHVKVMIMPQDIFGVECPTCQEVIEVQANEDIDGSYSPEPECAFIRCECGQLIEAVGIRILPVSAS